MKNKLIIVGTVVTLTFSGFGIVGSVDAETSVSEKKANVTQKLNSVETDILNASKKINEINLDIDALESAVQVNKEEITRVTNETEKYEKEIDNLKDEIKTLEKEIKARNEILKERLSSYQNSGGDLGFMDVIFGSSSFEDFISRFTAATTITKADNKLVEEQKTAIDEVEIKEEQVKKKLSETEKTKQELVEINKTQKTQKEELSESKKSVEAKIADLEAKKSAYIEEGNDLVALEEQIEAELRASEAGLSEDTETRSSNDSENQVSSTEETNEEDQASQEQVIEPNQSESSSTQSQPTASPEPSQSSPARETATPNEDNEPEPATQTPTETKPKPKKEAKPDKPSLAMGKGVIADAHSLTGTSYLYGSNGNLDPSGKPTSFDCSGYTTFVYKKNGINLPRTAQQQYNALKSKMKKNPSQLRAGDLVFFGSSENSIMHVGISLGGTQFIGSQSSTGVATTSFSSGYWKDRYIGGASPR